MSTGLRWLIYPAVCPSFCFSVTFLISEMHIFRLFASSAAPCSLLYRLYCVPLQVSTSLHNLLPNYPLVRNLLFSCHFLCLFVAAVLPSFLSMISPLLCPSPLAAFAICSLTSTPPFGLLHLVSLGTVVPSILIFLPFPPLAPFTLCSLIY